MDRHCGPQGPDSHPELLYLKDLHLNSDFLNWPDPDGGLQFNMTLYLHIFENTV